MLNKLDTFGNAISLRAYLNDNISNVSGTDAQTVEVLQRSEKTIEEYSSGVPSTDADWVDVQNTQIVWTGMNFVVVYEEGENKILVPFEKFYWRIIPRLLKLITITFNPNDGIIPESTEKTVLETLEIGTLPTATKENYSFSGWYTTTGSEVPDTGVKYEINTIIPYISNREGNSMTLYARWESEQEETPSEP